MYRALSSQECAGILERAGMVVVSTDRFVCDHIGVDVGLENQPQAIVTLAAPGASTFYKGQLPRHDFDEGTVWLTYGEYSPFIRGSLPNPKASRGKVATAINSLTTFWGCDAQSQFPLEVFRLGSDFLGKPLCKMECAYDPAVDKDKLYEFLGNTTFTEQHNLIHILTRETPALPSVYVELSLYPPEPSLPA